MNLFGTDVTFMRMMGAYAFLALVPFILLYLLRPKIVTQTIPSLMFLYKEHRKSKHFSFFQKLMANVVFFLQLLAILLIATALMDPVIRSKDTSTVHNTFVIVDSSASMQTKTDGGQTRYDKAISIANDKMQGNVNLMFASNVITVPVRDGWASEGKEKLRQSSAGDGVANVEGAMQRADQLLDKKNAKVIVISDFINVMGSYDDPLKAKRILSSKGDEVEFIDLGSKASNIGIVDMIPADDKTEVYVKNFNDEKATVQITVNQGGKELFKEARNVFPKSTEIFKFDTPKGESIILLSPEDDFLLDNKAYLSTPLEKKAKVLLLTSIPDNQENYLRSALKASPFVDLQILHPPFTIENVKSIKPEIIITHQLNRKELVVGDFEGISKLVHDGTKLVITSQPDLKDIDFSGMLPVNINGTGQMTPVSVVMQNQFTKDMDFGTLDMYLKATAKNGTTTILEASDSHTPLLVFSDYGSGIVAYHGIIDNQSEFKSTPSYPIHWNNMVNFLAKKEDIKDYNKKIGESQNYVNTGFFDEQGKRVAVNLLSEKESDVGNQHEDFTQESSSFVVEKRDKIKTNTLEFALVIIVMIILSLELIVVKMRGDL